MPRYWVDTYSRRFGTPADEGVDVPDLAALERLIRRSLADIARDEDGARCDAFSASAVDADGELVMSMTLTVVTTIPQPRKPRDDSYRIGRTLGGGRGGRDRDPGP